jgi:hypothetical protein
LDDGDQLEKFLGLIKKFNNGSPLDKELKLKIERHFNNKWKFDRNQAFYKPEELSLLD